MPNPPNNALLRCFLTCLLAACCGLGEGDALRAVGDTPAGPSVQEVRSKVRAYCRVSTHPGHRAARAKILAEMKAGGPRWRVQQLLAGFYPEADQRERLAVLYIFNAHTLKEAGCENALGALPAIAEDFAKARPDHPNPMSFQGFYCLEQFMHFAWKKLPAHSDQPKAVEKLVDLAAGDAPPPLPQRRSSADGLVHTGALADRKAIVQIIVEKKLHSKRPRGEDYRLPDPNETDWIRIIGSHAFVRLRGKSSGTDYIFLAPRAGKWALLTSMGDWVN